MRARTTAVLRRAALLLALGGLVGVLLQAPGLSSDQTPADAAVAADWQAGNIIDDTIFYDSDALSVTQIQQFLVSKEPSCTGTCLRNYKMKTPTINAGTFEGCPSKYAGSSSESAASIIAKVAVACGINPEVLLVILEKEQSAVSSRALDPGKIAWATGCGVPDNGPSETAQQGFFRQLMCAASRLQYYRLHNSSYGYHPGQYNSILYNPKTSCGSSKVYIENWATAVLYIYTPYQPTPAALDYLYGSVPSSANKAPNGVSGCASYGNRNFWRIFTDWFGSTHSGGTLVTNAGDTWLITGAGKHKVAPEAVSFFAKLGPARAVSSSYLAAYTTMAPMGRGVSDPLSGTLAMVQTGKRWTFSSCDEAALWGYDCQSGTLPQLMPNQIKKFPIGGKLTDYFTSSGSYYVLDSGKKDWIDGAAAVQQVNGGTMPYTGLMDASAAAALRDGSPYLLSGGVYEASGSTATFLVDSSGTKYPLTSSIARAFGLPAATKAQAGSWFARYPTADQQLTQLVTCSGSRFFAAGGSLHAVTAAAAGDLGIDPVPLSAQTCATLPKSSGGPLSTVFVSLGSGPAYQIKGGKAHVVLSQAQLNSIAGTKNPPVLKVSQAELAAFPLAGDLIPAGARLTGGAGQFVADGQGGKIPVQSSTVLTSLGLASDTLYTVPQAVLDTLPTAADPLSPVLDCGSALYFAANGTLYTLTDAAAANALGLGISTVSPKLCASLTVSPRAARSVVVVRVGTGTMYLVKDGRAAAVISDAKLVALGGGKNPGTLGYSASELAALPLSTELIPVGTVIQAAGSSDKYLVEDPGHKIAVNRAAATSALGFSATTVGGLDRRLVDTFATDPGMLGQVFRCDSRLYFGAAGTLHPLASNTTGLDAVTLQQSLCDSRPKGGEDPLTSVFVKTTSAADVYRIADGKAQWMSPAAATALNGGTAPRALAVAPTQLSALPLDVTKIPVGTTLQGSGSPSQWIAIGAGKRLKMRNWTIAQSLGLYSKAVRGVAPKVMTTLTSVVGQVVSSGLVRCDGTTYYAAGGKLHAVSSPGTIGLPVASLPAKLCSTLTKAQGAALKTLFVRITGSTVIYQVAGGQAHRVPDTATLKKIGGANPVIISVTAPERVLIPLGTTLPKQH